MELSYVGRDRGHEEQCCSDYGRKGTVLELVGCGRDARQESSWLSWEQHVSRAVNSGGSFLKMCFPDCGWWRLQLPGQLSSAVCLKCGHNRESVSSILQVIL